MYILADIKWNCRKLRFIQKQRRLLKKNKDKKLYFDLKDFIFWFKRFYILNICKLYICKVTYNTYDNPNSVAKVDYRGAAAPKKCPLRCKVKILLDR